MAIDQKYLEGFGPLDNTTPLTRAIEGTWEGLKHRAETAFSAARDPNIGLPEKVAHGALQGGGALLDVIGGVGTFVGDTVVPGTPMQDLAGAAMQTKTAEDLMGWWENQTPEDQRRMSSAGVGLEALGTALGFGPAIRSVSRNARAFQPNFYGSNLPAKLLGVLQNFGAKGSLAGLKQAVTPSGQALLRQGVPEGAVQEVTGLVAALRLRKGIEAKLKEGEKLDPAEAMAHKELLSMGSTVTKPKKDAKGNIIKGKDGKAVKEKVRELGSDATVASYIEGSLATRMNLLRQQGKDVGILEALVENPLASRVGPAGDREAVKAALGDVPEGVKDRIMKHAYAIHNVGDKDLVVNRGARTEVNLQGEASGNRGSVHGRVSEAFNNEARPSGKQKVGHMQKRGYEQFASDEQMVDFINASRLDPEDQATYAHLKHKVRTGESLNPREPKTLGRIEDLLDKKGRVHVSAPDEDGFVYFQGGHHSAAKELGGVNAMTGFNRTTGDAYTTITDGSDLFGVKGPGMKGLVTIVEPVKWNAYAPVKKGTTSRQGAPVRSTREEAIAATQKLTGVAPSTTVPKANPLTGYMGDVMEQYRPQAQARDYISAMGNVAKIGGTQGMFLGNNMLHRDPNEQ